jgi:hypothetical protein
LRDGTATIGLEALAAEPRRPDTADMTLVVEPRQLLYAVLLTPEERAVMLRALRCVEDNWTLEPAEEDLIVRLEALEGRAVPVPIPAES